MSKQKKYQYNEKNLKTNDVINTPPEDIAKIPADQLAELICYLVLIREHQLTFPQRKQRQYMVYNAMVAYNLFEGNEHERSHQMALSDSKESNYKTIRSLIRGHEAQAKKSSKVTH